MRERVSFGLLILLLLMAACSDKERIYQGVYEGFENINQHQKGQDPSYDPAQERLQGHPSYQQYKQEREEILKKEESESR